jgi:hypothetical protein
VVDDDCGIPESLLDAYRIYNNEVGPLAQSDPRSLLLSMSEYDKTQNYDVYGKFSPISQMSALSL